MIISAVEGVQGHSETIWELLNKYKVPTFIFINKIDREGAEVNKVINEMKDKLSEDMEKKFDSMEKSFRQEFYTNREESRRNEQENRQEMKVSIDSLTSSSAKDYITKIEIKVIEKDKMEL